MARVIDYAITGCKRDLRVARKKGDKEQVAFLKKELEALKETAKNPLAFAEKQKVTIY